MCSWTSVSRNDVGHLLYLTGVFIPIWQRGFSWTVFWQTRYFPTPAVFRYQFFPVVMLFWIQFSVGPVVELWPKSRHFIIASLYVSNVMFNVQTSRLLWFKHHLALRTSGAKHWKRLSPQYCQMLKMERLVGQNCITMTVICVQGIFSFLWLRWPWQKVTSEQGHMSTQQVPKGDVGELTWSHCF